MAEEFIFNLPDFVSDAAYVAGPYSRLSDTHAPTCDLIVVPPRVLPGRQVRFRRYRGMSSPVDLSLRSRAKRIVGAGGPATPSDLVMMDMRFQGAANWSHYLNSHIPIFLHGMALAGLTRADVHILFPQSIPAYITEVTRLLGFTCSLTDADVAGEFLAVDHDTFGQLRLILREIVLGSGLVSRLLDQVAKLDHSFPKKIFLSRQRDRTIENEIEIEAFLATRGFVKIYPEDFSPLEQIGFFQNAEQIIGIHGAALAPILYVDPAKPPEFLIEIFPPCLAIDCFKSISQLSGIYWTAVRGKLKPQFIDNIYNDDLEDRRRTQESFAVDVQSVALALALAEARAKPQLPAIDLALLGSSSDATTTS